MLLPLLFLVCYFICSLINLSCSLCQLLYIICVTLLVKVHICNLFCHYLSKLSVKSLVLSISRPKKFSKAQFYEEEAELSGSDVGDDENDDLDSELDEYESDSEIEDLPSESKLKAQVHKAHMYVFITFTCAIVTGFRNIRV